MAFGFTVARGSFNQNTTIVPVASLEKPRALGKSRIQGAEVNGTQERGETRAKGYPITRHKDITTRIDSDGKDLLQITQQAFILEVWLELF